ncbi:group III truncated hemoglobin [Deinococcus petrolearius]|uniref:Group III truncated hemoglobin n=1 Tax=Deinococcus petrolearius TaxID=1751295 RepID=A0ABW1DI40_9DEIO
MAPPLLLTTAPLPACPDRGWPEAAPVSEAALAAAGGLLVPHDGGPAADLRERPDRWALLHLMTGALRRDVPLLAWGSGAALVGRALGAPVHAGHAGAPDWAEVPAAAEVHLQSPGGRPLHWTAGRATAWADPEVPPFLLAAFLAGLDTQRSRRPATPLETVGGEAALRAVLADFYARAARDPLLGPVFAAHVRDWAAHLDHVTAFWVTVLGGAGPGGEPAWRGNLNHVHAGLGLRGEHLARWLTLFAQAARAHLPPEAAEVLTSRAGAMGTRLGAQAAARRS